jgi:hypothetical protein
MPPGLRAKRERVETALYARSADGLAGGSVGAEAYNPASDPGERKKGKPNRVDPDHAHLELVNLSA